MKKIFCLGICLALIFGLVACGQQPVAPDNTLPSTEATQQSTEPALQLRESPDGCYQLADDHYVQVRSYGAFVVLEHWAYETEEHYDTWVQEFWCDDDASLSELATGVQGKLQTVSRTTDGTAFEEQPQFCTLTAAEDGLVLTLNEEEIKLTDSLETTGLHNSWQELLQMLKDMTESSAANGPVGSWYDWDGQRFVYMKLEENGRFFLLYKEKNHPVDIFEGGWLGENGSMTMLVEQLGTGKFPQQMSLNWSDVEGMLFLEDTDGLLSETLGSFVEMCAYNPEMEFRFFSMNGLGYLTGAWDLEDEFYDSEGNTMYCLYQLPRWIGTTDTVVALNEDIQNAFGSLIEAGYADVTQGRKPYCELVYWDQYIMGDVIGIIISADTVDGTQKVAYYYDTAKDQRVYGADVLAIMGVDETAYLDSLYNQVRDVAYSYLEDPESAEGQACLAWTLSEDNLNLERPFAWESDVLFTYVQIETPEGTWWDVMYPLYEPESVG